MGRSANARQVRPRRRGIHEVSEMIAVLDSAVYQFAGCSQRFVGESVQFTTPATIPAPDLTTATAFGVRGVLARATNADAIDPTYRPTVAAAVRDGVAVGPYAYLRPTFNTVEAHVAALVTAVEQGGAIGLPPMADCEAMHPDRTTNGVVEAEWAGRRYADWLHHWLDRVAALLGRRPMIYTGAWWWDRMLAGCGHEFADYDFVVSHYPHQPSTGAPWPPVPRNGAEWYEWARTTQGGDAGAPSPNLPVGATAWAGWQMTSALSARDFGFSGSGALDGNVVTDEAWARWTARAPKSLTMPPTLRAGDRGHAVNVLQNVLNVWSAGQGRAMSAFTNEWNADLDADLRWFQGYAGLTVDGIAGPRTWTALLRM